ncbi:MAG: hypothetical protein ACRDXB_05345, partial [Actinomycetes bacterium]
MSRTITFQEAGSHARGDVRIGDESHVPGESSAYAMYTSGWAAVGVSADVNAPATTCAGGQLPC